MATPLSLKVAVPRLPGDGATVAVRVTNMPPVVASGVATSVVDVAAGLTSGTNVTPRKERPAAAVAKTIGVLLNAAAAL